ncbi:flagellar hook-length control protein FliK [Halomonas huangheensis]|uniref:Flagellar hook-length control protein-like C-terminal domain-containing protein n=1 Tax=Halomonas huangheensis TaxID=1178482 RepID=W1N5I3_9GAMM|nr:flagellar hook-length control protein FliK [Halomonas huangheensis]ALM54237.1 hypothetical protein AR456_19670 [Halomonas huangheensis]ERL50783.1 hypothetical protein BJB45_19500 [Halomonas huangheensis]
MDFSLLINTAPSARSAPAASNASNASGFAERLAAVSSSSSSAAADGKSDPGGAVLPASRDNGAVNDTLDQEHADDEGGVLAEALLIPATINATINATTLNTLPAQAAGALRHTGLTTTPGINTTMVGSTAASDSLAVVRERLQLMANASAHTPGSGTLSTLNPSPTHSEVIVGTLDQATSNAPSRHLLLDPEQLAQRLQHREQSQNPSHPATAPQAMAGSPSNTPPSPVDTNASVLTTQSLTSQSLTSQSLTPQNRGKRSMAMDGNPGSQLADGTSDDPFSASLAQANSASRAPASAMTGSIPANISSPEWSRQLGHTLTRIGIGPQTQEGDQRIELRLHPAELGPLSVSLRMGEHGAQAQFVSAHPHVRQAVEQALPQLREILAEQGIQLGQTSVSDHGQGTQGETSRDQSPGNGLATGNSPGNITDNSEPLITTNTTSVVMDGRVDLYA